MIALLLFLFIYGSICSEPAWTTYPANVMYSGEYKAFLTTKSTGLLATVTQTMYRTDVTAANYFASAPRVILSLMGYKQNAPANGDTFQGFDVRISSITITNFYVIHNIYGSSMAYLNYMYLAVSQTNTDFFLGQYTQTVDQASVFKSYSYDIAVNSNETYPNYPANTIEMKGFLAGYSLKQSTATAFQLNFTLNSKNASYFTIQVSTNANSVLQKINYYRIGYDRTAVERRNNRDVFRDFYFELINNVNVKTIYNVTWGSLGEFQYRNFMMGTNRISINGAAPIAVEFVLYYYFAKSLSTVDVTTPYVNNPAIAKYLHGDTFYHSIAVCAAPDIFYLPTHRKCYSTCPTLAYFTDTSSNTCISCHFTCRTCSAGYLIDKCLTCDTNYRVFNASTTKCDCPVKTYDDLTSVACPSCHATCLSCASSASDGCKTCDSSLNREFNDPNSDSIGQCLCKSALSENSTNQCQSCSAGCLTCSFSTGSEVCSNCNTSTSWSLVNGNCVCPALGYFTDLSSNSCLACHYTCKTCSAGSLADKCLTCETNDRVFNSSTTKCDCPAKTYDDLTNLACPSCHSSCLSCATSTSDGCQTCNSSLNRELNDQNNDGKGQCLCKLSFYEKQNMTQCQSCSNGCLNCTFSGGAQVCLRCNATKNLILGNSSCLCDQNYALINGTCKLQKCGDGILTSSEQCDDNNLINKDGCSSLCKFQPEHVCFLNTSISNYSICYFNGTIGMIITDVIKSLSSNQVTLSIKIDADSNINDDYLKNYLTDGPSIVIEDVPTRLLVEVKRIQSSSNTEITSINYDSTTKILQVTFSYNSTFDITTKKIKFQPSMSISNAPVRYFYNSPEAITNLQKTHNKIDTTYYDISDYQKASSLKYAFLALIAIFWVVSLIMIAIGKGNIGMEMMIVYQIAYASLLSQSKLQISFAGLLEFGKYTAGYNLELIKNQVKCVNFSAINLSCNLFNNLNISFFLMVFIAVIFWGLKLANKLLNDRAEQKFTRNRNMKIIPTIEQLEQKPSQQVVKPREVQRQGKNMINTFIYQELIPKRIYKFLLDLEFFFLFVTVIIWVMSISFIKDYGIESIVDGVFISVLYFFLWIYYFVNYSNSDFSFVQLENKLVKQQDQASRQVIEQVSDTNRLPTEIQQKKNLEQKKNIKIMIYPVMWLLILGIGIFLAVSNNLAYVLSSLIIAGSVIFLLLTVFLKIHQQKLQMIRTAFNCVIVTLIQITYILYQSGSIFGSGPYVMIIIIVLLSLVVVSNSTITFYLWSRQTKEVKEEEEEEVRQLHIVTNVIQAKRPQNSLRNMGAFLKFKDEVESEESQSQYERTIKKDVKYMSFNTGKTKYHKQKISKLEINSVFDQSKAQLSQGAETIIKREDMPYNSKLRMKTQTKEDNKKLQKSPKNLVNLPPIKVSRSMRPYKFSTTIKDKKYTEQ